MKVHKVKPSPTREKVESKSILTRLKKWVKNKWVWLSIFLASALFVVRSIWARRPSSPQEEEAAQDVKEASRNLKRFEAEQEAQKKHVEEIEKIEAAAAKKVVEIERTDLSKATDKEAEKSLLDGLDDPLDL